MKPTRTWILVADGGGARILEAVGTGHDGLHEVSGSETRTENPPSHDQGRDRPGRVYESVGQTRHSVEPRRDPHKALESLFADQLATMLAKYAASNSFDRLVIVAPPTMLGHLRNVMPPAVRAKIIAEIDKDLTKVPNVEISTHIADVIAL
jgi:protein required for attachment to host cells